MQLCIKRYLKHHNHNLFSIAVKCPDDWTLNGHHCYRFFAGKKTWGDAVEHCNVLKGSLVSIECSDDNLYVKGKLQTSTWSFKTIHTQQNDIRAIRLTPQRPSTFANRLVDLMLLFFCSREEKL